MCDLCESGTNHTRKTADAAIRLESLEHNLDKGHVLRCVCGQLSFQYHLIDRYDCSHCGHRMLNMRRILPCLKE